MRVLLLALALPLLALCGPAPILVQAEDLPYGGDWSPMGEAQALGRRGIVSLDEKARMPAVGFVQIPATGRWHLWVRAKDFPKDRPGIRRFAVEVNGRPAGREFGAHAVDRPEGPAWAWEDGGEFELDAGPALLALVPVTPWCRADAIALVPEGAALPTAAGAVAAATVMPTANAAPGAAPETVVAQDTGRELARLENADTALVFTQGALGDRPVVMARVDRRRNGAWRTVLEPRPEAYDVLAGAKGLEVAGRAAGILANWRAEGETQTVSLRDVRYETKAVSATGDPERAGVLVSCLPHSCALVGKTVELAAECGEGRVTARWRLHGTKGFPALALEFAAGREGMYGLRYAAIEPVAASAVEELTCPFLFNYRRLPKAPELIPTELTSTPMATVQLAGPRTVGVAFDPEDLPKEWPDCAEFETGFQLVTGAGLAQPAAWLVVPGGRGSRLVAGGKMSGRVRLIVEDGDWWTAYRRVARDLCGLRAYRQNHEQSLTQTLLNVVSLLADDEATGWSPAQMGFWNIESRNTVTHAAPLALVEAALLTGDEDLLARRAAPALAFLLSRPQCHVGTDPAAPGRYGRHELGRPTAQYGAAVRLSAWEMTGGHTPAFRELSFDEKGAPVRTPAGGTMDDALAAYRATGEGRHLDEARRLALEYAGAYLQEQTSEKPRYAFFQVTHTGNWRGLLAVAEATGDARLARMAAEIARRMVAGLYTWPKVEAGLLTIHRDNRTRTNGWCWFKGPDLFLLGRAAPQGDHPVHEGFADLEVPERRVPGWLPSVVGLGIEQPTTYRRGDGTCAHIVMANWAPHLLRLNELAPDPLFATAARNSTLGRWGTYPGYYRTDFTDLTRAPDYALKGPDVSGIYWHHIPCFLMMLADYLVTDIEIRSRGGIRFPAARQCGYVWFDNRLFGHRPGTVHGIEGVWPWLPRQGVAVERPEINWLAGREAESVFLFLANTTDTPVRTLVSLDLAAFDGTPESVAYRCDGGSEVPARLVRGACAVPVSGNGLTVVRVRGLRARVLGWDSAPPAASGPGYAALAKTDSVVGTVRANWIGFGPDRAFAHVYSDHPGDKAERAELRLEQDGAVREFSRDFWPLEFLVPVDASGNVRLTLTAIDGTGRRHRAPPLELVPPGP